MASTAIAAVWASTLPALPVVKNTGDRNRITTTSSSRISTGPSRITARATRISRERPDVSVDGGGDTVSVTVAVSEAMSWCVESRSASSVRRSPSMMAGLVMLPLETRSLPVRHVR